MTNTDGHEAGRVPRLSDHFRKAKGMTPTENKLIRDVGTIRANLALLDQIAREARGLAEGLRNVPAIFEQRFSVDAAGELVVSTAVDKPDQADPSRAGGRPAAPRDE